MTLRNTEFFLYWRHCPKNCVNGNAGRMIRIIFCIILKKDSNYAREKTSSGSRGTANEGRIPYIKLGGKVLYRASDVDKLLEKHYRESWK